MRRRPHLLILELLLTILLALLPPLGGGCAGEAARERVLVPAMRSAWPGLREDAELGVKARAVPEASAALRVEPISAGAAESRVERIRKFGEALDELAGPRR